MAFVLGTFQQPLLEIAHWGAHFFSDSSHLHSLQQHTSYHSHEDLVFISNLLEDTTSDSTPLASDQSTDKQPQINDLQILNQIPIHKWFTSDFIYIEYNRTQLHLKIPSPPPEHLLT